MHDAYDTHDAQENETWKRVWIGKSGPDYEWGQQD